MRVLQAGVLIVGGGLAALRAAYDARASGADVVLAVKGKAGRSGSSAMTSAGYSSAVGDTDSPQTHYRDTIQGGRRINDPKLARILADESPARLTELVSLGAPLAVAQGGGWRINPSGDHTVPRTVQAANHNGRDFTEPLTRAVLESGVRVLEMTAAVEILISNSEVAGAVLLDYEQPELVAVAAPSVVLATGGAGRLFAVTSNPNDATGDGYALSLRAGSALRDMEFIQFYPWRCIIPFERSRMPIQPSTFVLGATLHNSEGERFMLRHDPVRGEATMRDVAARGIYQEIAAGKAVKGGVRLDLSALTLEQWVTSNPKPSRHFLERNLDFHKEEMIVAPEAHFFMGGVCVDQWGASGVPGLFAVGEVAGGVHGANRLDSNAVPETQVFGARAGRAAARRAADAGGAGLDPQRLRHWESRLDGALRRAPSEASPYSHLRRQLQDNMWNRLGVVRSRAQMESGVVDIASLEAELQSTRPAGARDLLQHVQVDNSLLVARCCLEAALLREESRGAHYRSDFPALDDGQWRCSLQTVLAGGRLRTRKVGVEAGAPA